jgi:Arc/MetJ-type ribon-helix-helix transcriptional regulator
MNERVTVTIPEEIVRDIDRRENNRSRFILQAVQNELERRRKEELRRSLHAPHPESERLAHAGADDWIASLPEGDIDLVDVEAGESVRWIPGQGWTKKA